MGNALQVFNRDRLLDMIGEDADVLNEFVDTFAKNTEHAIADCVEAYDQRDMGRLHFLAHGLKGSAGTFGLERLHAASLVLETSARLRIFSQTTRARMSVRNEWRRFKDELDSIESEQVVSSRGPATA